MNTSISQKNDRCFTRIDFGDKGYDTDGKQHTLLSFWNCFTGGAVFILQSYAMEGLCNDPDTKKLDRFIRVPFAADLKSYICTLNKLMYMLNHLPTDSEIDNIAKDTGVQLVIVKSTGTRIFNSNGKITIAMEYSDGYYTLIVDEFPEKIIDKCIIAARQLYQLSVSKVK